MHDPVACPPDHDNDRAASDALLHIAQIAPLIYATPPATTGGTERVVHDLSAALVARGHTVTLFAADGSHGATHLVPQGPPIADVEGHPPGYPAAREATMLDSAVARADAFDIIHCHTEFHHAVALRPWRSRLVTTIHWRVDELDRQHYLTAFPDLAVASISRSQADAMPPEAGHAGTVYHGIPADRFALAAGQEGYVAFLGRLTDQKGPDRAIRAARGAGLPIRLAGDIDVGNPLYFEREVRPLLADDAVHVGPVGEAEKQEHLGNAAVFCFPIDWPEPFGLVMIEAMACGTPVVAMRHGSVPEIVEDGITGYVVDSEDQLPDALRRAARLDRATVRARFAERFTAARMAEGYEAIYERLARAASTPAGQRPR